MSKAAIENRIKLVIGISTEDFPSQVNMPKASKPAQEKPKLESPDDVANWKALAEDTQLNETGRRP